MTNQISKAREALDSFPFPYMAAHLTVADMNGELLAWFRTNAELLRHILTTLSSIDAERLGDVLDKPNPKPQKDWDVIIQAAATLHGLVRGVG